MRCPLKATITAAKHYHQGHMQTQCQNSSNPATFLLLTSPLAHLIYSLLTPWADDPCMTS